MKVSIVNFNGYGSHLNLDENNRKNAVDLRRLNSHKKTFKGQAGNLEYPAVFKRILISLTPVSNSSPIPGSRRNNIEMPPENQKNIVIGFHSPSEFWIHKKDKDNHIVMGDGKYKDSKTLIKSYMDEFSQITLFASSGITKNAKIEHFIIGYLDKKGESPEYFICSQEDYKAGNIKLTGILKEGESLSDIISKKINSYEKLLGASIQGINKE